MVHDLNPFDSFNANGVRYFTDSKKLVTCGAGSGIIAIFSFKFGMSDLNPANNFPFGPSIYAALGSVASPSKIILQPSA